MAPQKLAALRAWMRKQKIEALIVPHADRFQSEYLPPRDERLAWLTGFTGSNGMAIVTLSKAALFTDSRYTLQAGKEVNKKDYAILDMAATHPTQWLDEHMKPRMRVAVDPWLFTINQFAQWEKIINANNAELVTLPVNPIDLLWQDRPKASTAKAESHALKYAGATAKQKIKQMIAEMDEDAERILVSDPLLVCWLLNLRGRDVAHVPVLQSLALVTRGGKVTLFTDPVKVPKNLGLTVKDLDALLPILTQSKATLQIDPGQCPFAVKYALIKKKIALVEAADPCILLRACKNAVEIKGALLAHKKDAVAYKKFLAWFNKRDFAREKITEMDVAAKLREYRAADRDFMDDSFETIAGFAGNGAIVHYRANEKSNKRLQPGNLLLLDSGAQYRCGTTDITRTLAIGKPTSQMKQHYQAVYKGLQALSATRFPFGTSGAQLEAIARCELWALGLDYGHGTGHGVGSYLSVHEGPQGFTARSHAPLRPGMILSIEPGVYHTGKFGIRLENLVVVVEDPRKGDMKKMLAFRTLTDVAFDGKLLK